MASLTKEEQAALDYQEWVRKNPKAWIQDPEIGLGVKGWWEGMDRMTDAWLEGIETRKPVVIGSGHALSKDFLNSGCAPLWFMNAYGPKCQVAMTAPTDRQVKKVMWAEMTARYNNSVLKDNFGRLLVCNLEVAEDWYCLAFTTKETGGSVGKFQGFHASATMVIVSEAQAIHDDIYEQIDGILTSHTVLFVLLGNPVRTTGKYARMLKDKKNNIIVNLSCLDSPNVIAGSEVVPGMCSKRWVDDKRERWNKDGTGKDPRWMGRVLGLVPTTSIDNIISDDLYGSCIEKQLFEPYKTGVIGVDPARFGDDDMVISVWESKELVEDIIIPKCDAVKGAGEVVKAQKKYFPEGQCTIVVDCDGLGGPYLDNIKHMIPDELDVKYVEFKGSLTDKQVIDQEYANLRAEAAFYAQKQMTDGNVSLDDDERALEEATEEKYFINLKGKIQVENKEDLKDRIGRSPNQWDARRMAIWGFKTAKQIKPKDKWRKRSSGGLGLSRTGSPMAA